MPAFPKVLSGTSLKIIACASMFIDHTCATLFAGSGTALTIRLTVGRIAMPLFLFLLCEGFFYTHSRKKYAITLLITALVSEPIYDIALYGSSCDFTHQNVCFTLLFALLLLCTINYIALKSNELLNIPIVAAFCLASYMLNLSYDYAAMITVAVLYYLHWHESYIQGLAGSAIISIAANTPGAFLASVPTFLYNGKRGAVGGRFKYFFYAFYPAHLFILYLIKILF